MKSLGIEFGSGDPAPHSCSTQATLGALPRQPGPLFHLSFQATKPCPLPTELHYMPMKGLYKHSSMPELVFESKSS